jgi:pilus assembly protein Flp/PilA
MKKLMRFFKDEDGATAVEYGIMVALIAAAIITTVYALGQRVNTVFTTVDGAMQNPSGAGS